MSDTTLSGGEASVAARDQALGRMFAAGEPVWLSDTRYNAVELLWDVDLVRPGAQGRWMFQRYSYDTSAGILHFRGERLLGEEELAALRRSGRRIN
jgi:hypothetical protein